MSLDICHKAYAGATKACGTTSGPTLKKLTGVPNDFAKFMISLGIQKNGDKYTFKKDDDLYRELKTLKQQTQNYHHTEDERLANLIQSYDFDEFKTIYDKYQQHKQKTTEPISDSDITTMNCKDLFKFKNIEYAKNC